MSQDTPTSPQRDQTHFTVTTSTTVDAPSAVRDGSQMVTPRVVPDAPHGTLRGWKMGCRCTCCHAANNAQYTTNDDQATIPTPRASKALRERAPDSVA